MFADAFIEAFVMAGNKNKMAFLREGAGKRLGEQLPLGAEKDNFGLFGPEVLKGIINRPNHKNHAFAAAIGTIVSGFVLIFSPLTEIVDIYFHKIVVLGFFEHRGGKGTGKHIRKKGENVDLHSHDYIIGY